MTRYTLHVPECRNDGSPVEPELFDLIEAEILARADGYTLTSGIGAYRGDGTTYREPIRLYAVDADCDLVPVARIVARLLDQELVYVTAQDIAPMLVTRVAA